MQRGRSASAPHSRPPIGASSSASRLRTSHTAEDTPHTAGSEECLCSSCHLKTYFFPRRQDGRIVLPNPSLTRPPGPPTVDPTHPSDMSRGPGPREDREVSIPRHIQIDEGEGDSAGSVQLSGPGVPAGVQDDWKHLPPLIRDFELPNLTGRATPRMPAPEIHPSRLDRLRPSRKKPYDTNSKRPEPWPRISEIDQIRPLSRSTAHSGRGFSDPYTEINSHQSTISSNSGRLSWPDPYETIAEEPFPQLFISPAGLGDRELNLSGTSSTFSQTMSSSHDNEQQQTPIIPYYRGHHAPSRARSASQPPRYEHTNMPPRNRAFPSPQVPPRETSSNIEDPPKLIRFNSRHNPQPDTWGSRIDVDNPGEGDRSQEGPSQQQSQLRFQNPMVPESYIPSTSSRDPSIVHVKWDSERKRRQGYFAQEEGAEKSPFRHYNKTGCDFNG